MLKNIKNTVVYHGSYTTVNNINLKHASRNKDFGIGFYVTTDKIQAIKFAKITAKRHNQKIGYLNSYMLSDFKELKVNEFNDANIKWLNCITGFRDDSYSDLSSKYIDNDVIIGKIADDATSLVLNAYVKGVYGEVGSKEAGSIAIKRLKPDTLKNQICLKSTKAIKRLEFIDAEVVEND